MIGVGKRLRLLRDQVQNGIAGLLLSEDTAGNGTVVTVAQVRLVIGEDGQGDQAETDAVDPVAR